MPRRARSTTSRAPPNRQRRQAARACRPRTAARRGEQAVRTEHKPGAGEARGLVLLALLIFLALAGLATALGAESWATVRKRDRETELLFVGDQYRRAIESYWRAGRGRARTLPPSLEVLLADDRFPTPVRHLRRLYPD